MTDVRTSNKTLEFRVLGTLEARVDGIAIDVGGVRQRRLLALLLADADRAVSTNAIAERLWDDHDRPDDAIRAIRTYTSRLRRSLSKAGVEPEKVIVTEAPGYRLVADGQLDSARIGMLLAEARTLGESSPGAALDALDEAIGLWRGEPYSEFADLDWAQPEVTRLVELRRTVLEERAALRLAVGAHAEVAADLESLVSEDPLRSRPVELLMTALYRSGRQAEALRVAARHREELADVGLDLPESVAVLEAKVATSDESLQLAVHTAKTLRGYELLEQIGQGTFSIVYRGSQPSLGREVAVKQIRAELADRPGFIRCFEAEAHVVACLEHPYIVPIHDYWREPGAAFLVMRWMRGGTLESRITSDPLDTGAAMEAVVQVGSALAAAHQAGVVHRDVKSANVFLDGEGNYFLGDFGIAIELADDDPEALLSVGSPAYASPEQLRREAVGPSADIYGLGIVAFEALTGRLPYPEDRSLAEITSLKSAQPVGSVRMSRSNIPEALDAVLARATAPSPADRHRSVAEFVDDFVAACGRASRRAAPGRATLVRDAPNPYKGLRAFDEADAADFYGRDRLIDRLVKQLESDGPTGRLVAAVGPSGSGKSSVVRAGLLPRIRGGAIAGSETWFVATMLPGPRPFEELEAALNHISASPTLGLVEVMTSDERGIARAVKSVLADDSSELLLVIDQFEELFTQVEDSRSRDHFLNGLLAAVTESRSRLRVVATIRADFWDRPLRVSGMAQVLERSAVTVTPLVADELEQAIIDPARSVGVELDTGLLAEIVADLHAQPGALPLLQYALTELYDHRTTEGLLTRDAYHELGGVTGALARRAETLYEQSSTAEQHAARSVFVRLVNLADGGQETRRRVDVATLSRTSAARDVIDRYGSARLLSFDRNPTTREPTVEISHEALISEWPRLRNWLDEDRDQVRALTHLSEAATNWHAGGRDPADLYRGARLSAAVDLSDLTDFDLTPTESEFLDTSLRHHQSELQHQRRTNRRLRALLIGVAVALAAAIVGAFIAVVQQNKAQQASDESQATAEAADTARMTATARLLAGEDQPVALLLAAESYARDQSVDSVRALHAALTARLGFTGTVPVQGTARQVEFASDGSIVIGTSDRGIQIYDSQARDHDLIRTIEYPSTGHIATAYDEPFVATTDGAEVVVFDTTTGATQTRFVPDSIAGPERIWFAPTGELLVASEEGGLVIYDAAGNSVGELSTARVVRSVDFTSDGSLLVLATGDPQDFRIWDYASSPELSPVSGLPDLIEDAVDDLAADESGPISVAFGPDDDSLVGGFADGRVVVWDTATWQAEAELTDQTAGRPSAVRIIDADPIRVLAMGDQGMTLWSLDAGSQTLGLGRDPNTPVRRLDLQPGRDLAFGASAATLVTVSDLVEVWSTDDAGLLAVPLGGPAINYVSASRSGDYVITQELGASSGTIMRRDLATGEQTTVTDDGLFGANLSPDDSFIVTGSPTCSRPPCGSLQLWDASTLEPIGEAVVVPPGLQRRAFSPDSRFLAVGYGSPVAGVIPEYPATDGTIEIYEVSASGLDKKAEITDFRDISRVPVTLDATLGVFDLVFSSDGSRLLAQDASDGESSLAAEWSVPDGHLLLDSEQIHDLIGGHATGRSSRGDLYAWRPSETTLALVDQKTLEQQGAPFLSAEGGFHNFARFNADDSLMFTISNTGTAMWDVETRSEIGEFPNRSFEDIVGLAAIHDVLPATSPVGPAIVTTTPNQLLAWNLDIESWPDIACAAAGRNLTIDEWERYGPDEPYRPTCEEWPTPAEPDT